MLKILLNLGAALSNIATGVSTWFNVLMRAPTWVVRAAFFFAAYVSSTRNQKLIGDILLGQGTYLISQVRI